MEMIRLIPRLSMFIGVLALVACSSSEERVRSKDILGPVLQGLKKKTPPPSGLTRAEIADVTDPILLVSLEKTGGQGLLGFSAANGNFITWRTLDDAALTLNNNILTSTRKLGEDLMTSSPPTGVANHPQYLREYSYLGGDEVIWKARAVCSMRSIAAENIVVLDTAYDTTLYEEVCTSTKLGDIRNTFWVDGRGIAVKSRQFVSQDIGYIGIERINS